VAARNDFMAAVQSGELWVGLSISGARSGADRALTTKVLALV
jgi:hypothetical protein